MRKLLLLATISLAAIAVMPASADTFTYQFTSDHCSTFNGNTCLPPGATNMGTITVSDNADGSVTVTVNLAAGFSFVSTGAGTNSGPGNPPNASFFFRLNPNPTITYSNITPSSGWTIPNVIGTDQQAAGSYAGDGLQGQFEYALACNPPGSPDGCGTGGSDPLPPPLTFTVTGAGVTAASFNDPGASGSPFAADVISSTGATGLIDASLCTDCNNLSTEGGQVPEPASIALLGSILVGVTAICRKKVARAS